MSRPPADPRRISARASALVALVALVVSVGPVTVAHADEPAALTKPEATALVTGRKVSFLRARDGATITWDRTDGTVYYQTSNTTRQSIPSGAYTIDEDGAVCLKWTPDRHNALTDGCVVFRRDGDRTVVTGKRSGTVTGTLIDAS